MSRLANVINIFYNYKYEFTVYAYKSLRVEKVQFEVILLMPVNEKQYLRFLSENDISLWLQTGKQAITMRHSR